MFARSHTIKDYPGQAVGVASLAALIGAITALLVTPRRGSEMRHGIKYRGLLMKDKVANLRAERADRAAAKAKYLADKAADRAKETADKAKDTTKE